MSTSAVRMAAYAEHLEDYPGIRERHEPGVKGCVHEDHCYEHHVDEPDNGDVYRSCMECRHVFVTEEDLQREDLSVRTQLWQSDLRVQLNAPRGGQPPNHGDAPVARPGDEIFHCPLCVHDF